MRQTARQLFYGALIFLLSATAQAGTCFAIDDDSNTIVTYDSAPPLNVRFTTPIVTFGATIDQVEAAYFDSVSNRYYVVRQSAPNVFGYVLPNSGVFIPVGANLGVTSVPTVRTVGTGNTGNNRIVGLTRNPLDNKWYVIDIDGFIHEVNPITGSFVPGSFSGNDYVRVRTPAGALVAGVEDFAFDNAGRLFVVQNLSSANQFLRDVNLTTGLAVSALDLGVSEAEGLTNALGEIRLIIGQGNATLRRNFYRVDTTTGALTLLFNVPNPTAANADFEATGCNDGLPRADLKLNKTVSPAATAPGGTTSFTLRVEHEGIDIAYRIRVTDTLQAGMSIVSSTLGPCGVCSFDIPSGVWSIDQLDIGQVRTLTLVVSVSGVATNTLAQNRAQISQQCTLPTGVCVPLTDVDSTPNNKTGASWTPTEDDEAIAGVLVTVLPSAAKSFTPSSGSAGQTTLLVITLFNQNSSSSATLTSALTDTYPSGMVNSAAPAAATSCGGAGAVTALAGANTFSLGAGRVIPVAGSCSVSVVVSGSAVNNYINVIPVGALNVVVAGVPLSNAVGTTATYLVLPMNVGLLKDITPDAIGPGQTATLKLTLSNPANVTATLLSNLTDIYPAGLTNGPVPNAQTSCSGGAVTAAANGPSAALLAGASIGPLASCTVTVVLTAIAPGSYVNTIASGSLNTSVGSNSANVAATLLVDNPSVAKSFTPPAVQVGQTSVLRLTLSNPRTTSATLTVAFIDVYPTAVGGTLVNAVTPAVGSTCVGALPTATAGTNFISIPAGTLIPPLSACVINVTVTSNPNVFSGALVNTVPAGSLTTNLGLNLSAVAATLTFTTLTNLSVAKAVSTTSAMPSTTLGYTVTVVNLGPNAATGATLTDVAQGIGIFGPVLVTGFGGGTATSVTSSASSINATLTMPVNATVVFVFRALPTSFNGFVTNTASVSPGAGQTDSNLANNQASVQTSISPTANLSVAKINSTTVVIAGSTSLYTVTFANAGPSDASGALIKDIPSAGLACLVQSCTVTGGALCGPVTSSALLTGYAIPTFPSGSTLQLIVACGVTATGL